MLVLGELFVVYELTTCTLWEYNGTPLIVYLSYKLSQKQLSQCSIYSRCPQCWVGYSNPLNDGSIVEGFWCFRHLGFGGSWKFIPSLTRTTSLNALVNWGQKMQQLFQKLTLWSFRTRTFQTAGKPSQRTLVRPQSPINQISQP